MRWQTLAKLDTEDLGRAADFYKSLSSAGDQGKERLNKNVAPGIRGKLEGCAADAALRQVGRLSDNFHYMQVQTGLIRANIELLQEVLSKAQVRLNQALQEAKREGFTVEFDGSVSHSAASSGDDDGNQPDGGTAHGADPEKSRALAVAQEIAEAVGQATEADRVYARVLRRLKADDDLYVSSGDWNDTAADTKASRKAAAQSGPSIPPPPEGGDPQENKQWWNLLSDENRENYLALYPAEIGVLDGLPADIRDEANRAEMAMTKGRYETELDQLGAEKPRGWRDRRDHINDTLKGIEAVESCFDRTGVKGLPAAYLLGFDPKGRGDGRIILANGNPDTADHGSAVVGEAAKGHRLPADDIMFQGSPGVHVRRAGDLGVGADHVWAVGADNTVDDTTVRQGGRAFHGGGPDRAIPTDERFGGNVMDYGPWGGATGHGKYWDEESDGDPTVSLRNMSKVVVGDYINVTLEE
ncbi:alpha/beta hydrolase [Streptomyces sp. NPDC006990]|uniref:alpha/beta hydrolase n=1 Tax=unclassified Streptomyces TaxID=2593676 RepID=UPI0034551F3F